MHFFICERAIRFGRNVHRSAIRMEIPRLKKCTVDHKSDRSHNSNPCNDPQYQMYFFYLGAVNLHKHSFGVFNFVFKQHMLSLFLSVSLAVQLAWVIAAVLVTALGASLYQTADLGIAPYDYLSLGLRDYTPCPYFGCRIFTDALSALLCWLLGGLVGLGTLICAFCLGPFIQFFDRTFSQKVLQYKPNN